MEKLQIKEAIVVEGRYDKNHLSQVVDALILETNGFGIFKDKKKMEMLRKLAKERGLLVLTDGDGAGFVIRNKLIGSIPKEQLKHAYIPDIYGKERRKTQSSKEGKLGVEGMPPQVLRDVLAKAGVEFQEQGERTQPITSGDFLLWGLTGGEDSQARREKYYKILGLPENMSKKAFLQWANSCYTKEEFQKILEQG